MTKPTLYLVFKQVYNLDKAGRTDAALDELYDFIDEEFKDGYFKLIDDLLSWIDTDSYSINILIGLLSATLPAKTKLPNRKAFYDRVESTLGKRNELESGLLNGLF